MWYEYKFFLKVNWSNNFYPTNFVMGDGYELGDLFWAKVGSHPWWPCMIYYTPDGESYVRNKGKSACYHVQFLGPLVERAWVYPTNLIPFEGKKKFEEYVQERLKNSKDKNEKAKFDAKSTCSNRTIWIQSWKEAENAMSMPTEKRIEKFGRISVKSKVRRLSKSEEGNILQLLSSVPLTLEEEAESLSAYLQEEIEIRTEKNPEIDRKLLEDELRAQWPSFDIPTKRSYLQDKLSIFQPLSQDKNPQKGKSGTEQNSKAAGSKSEKTNKKRQSDVPNKHNQEQRELDIEIHRLIVSPAQYRYQPVCHMCEVYSNAPGQMFKCHGPCGRLVHPACMRYKTPPPTDNNRADRFRCPECLTGNFLCRICGKPGDTSAKSTLGPVVPCQAAGCGRHFHRDCLLDWPGVTTRPPITELKVGQSASFQLMKCPAHCCNTCVSELDECSSADSPLPGSKDQELLQCVRCPAAFHTGDLCTPAGSVEVSLSHVVCPRHYDQTLNNASHFKTQHPNWCFHCYNTTTDKVICRTCPTTYHKHCVQPSFGIWDGENFTCMSCRRGVFPRYAQIIWAKIQHFRWWPCEIIHARNAPINILNMVHPEGTFPIHFLGSDEYQWIARGCILPYEVGLKTSAARDNHGNKSVERAFTRALGRAPRAHQLYVNHVLKRQLPLTSMHADPLPDEELLPPASMDADIVVHRNLDEDLKATATANMTLIDENVYWTEDLLKKVQEDEASKISALGPCCACASSSESTGMKKCTTESQCLNRIAFVECDRSRCSFRDKNCGNRRFVTLDQKSEHNLFNVVRTVNRGYGVKTTMPFNQNTFVMEFRGEVIDLNEANRRLVDALGPSALATLSSSRKGCQPLEESYIIRLGPDRNLALDAASRGNLARFINHSCEPNLTAECWVVNGLPRLGLFAAKPIAANEELTLDYVLADFLATGLMGAHCLCLCGTDSCVSTLHLPSKFPITEIGTTQPEASTQSATAASSAIARRKSKRTEPEDSPAPDTKTNPEKDTRNHQVLSVVNLLAAAASNRSTARRDRALIQPGTAAARASNEPVKGKPGATSGTGISVAVACKSEQASSENNLSFTQRPPPHEDFCYRCGDGGELLLCDKTSCPKAFHLNCLGLSSPPAGIWYCPWHYCDQCGHPSTHLCWRCPNSYCAEHATEARIQVDELDRERWNMAQSGLNTVTNSALVSSFRWICVDHTGMRIHGPGHRPCLVPPDFQPNGTMEKSTSTRLPKSNVKGSSGSQDDTPTEESPESQQQSNEEAENVEPSQGAQPVSQTQSSPLSRSTLNEPRRVEPLKVTLKRKLKAEMAAMEKALADTDSSESDVARKRPATATLSPPVIDKKRPRLGKDSAAK